MSTRRTPAVVLLAVLSMLLTLTVVLAPSARAQDVTLTPYEQELTSLVNQAREASGRPPLTVAAGATDLARNWSARMSREQLLRHNPDLARDVEYFGASTWTSLAENVGRASSLSPKVLFDAYMASPGHRENILRASVRHVGMGAVRDSSGQVWNTMVFVDRVDGRYTTARVPGDSFPIDGGSTGGGGTPGPAVANRVFLSSSVSSPSATDSTPAPAGADRAVACDFDGDGRASLALFDRGIWRMLDRDGAVTSTFSFGRSGDQPVCGSWSGGSRAGIGVYRGGDVFLRDGASAGASQAPFRFGRPGDEAVAGDWDGNGTTTLGIARGNIVHLTNSSSNPTTAASFALGRPDDTMIAGDFDGDGDSTLAVVRGNVWYVTSSITRPTAAPGVGYGRPSDRPVVGDWSGSGDDGLGVYRP